MKLECDPKCLRNSTGRRLTQGLFYEFNNPNAPYTLRNQDFTSAKGVTYRSMYNVYMTSTDEYEAALRIVGSLGHWRMLTGLKWFTNGDESLSTEFEGLNQWRQDMAARDRCLAKQQLMEEAKNGSVTAQKEIFQSSGKVVKSSDSASKKRSQTPSGSSKVEALAKRFGGDK